MHVIDSAFNIFSLSLIFALIGFNVYLTTSIMKINDLTCDGAVALGGCAYGALVFFGINPIIAFLFSALLGVLAGFMTSSFATHIDVEPVLASIITLTAIQTFTVKLSAVGKIRLGEHAKNAIDTFSSLDNAILVCCVVLIVSFLFYRILNSEYGLAMRVFGDGKIISESLGVNCKKMMWIGLGLGNGLSAAAGALITQVTGNFSVGMGSGSLVFGIASVIIGEKLISGNSVKGAIIGCFVGAILYKIAIELFTFSGAEALGSDYSSVITAIVLIFLMASISEHRKKGRLENI